LRSTRETRVEGDDTMPAKNLILFTLDDFRTPEDWGHFASMVSTPNIDRLMEQGTTFTRAITQVPLCNPSRASVFSGHQPIETGVLDNEVPWYERVAPEDTLPAVLKAAGAHVALLGKNFHDNPTWTPPEGVLANEFLLPRGSLNRTRVINDEVWHEGPFRTGRYGGSPDDFADQAISEAAEQFLSGAGSLGKPFFLGVGFNRPHLDWLAPREYFDLYDPALIRAALRASLDDGTMIDGLDEYRDLPSMSRPSAEHGPIAKNIDLWADLIHGYLASISYADAQIGEVLDTLAPKPALAADTAIVLWSDNGFHLGDKDRWSKFTPWREATEVPLVVVDPDVAGGQKARQVVSLVDIFPTVLDLMEIDAPARLDLAGNSLLPIIENPQADWYDPAAGKGVALTTIYGQLSVRAHIPGQGDYRYTLHPNGQAELYDIGKDPREHANRVDLGTGKGLTAADEAVRGQMRELLDDELARQGAFVSTGGDLRGTAAAELFITHSYGRKPVLTGGAGADTYVLYRDATLVEAAGGGHDMVVFRSTSLESRFVLPAHVEQVEVQRTFTGNDHANRIYAAGRDTALKGAGGNDVITGGLGVGFLDGGAGHDTVNGRDSGDTLVGGGGNDSLVGNGGKDQLLSGADRDTLSGGGDADTLTGGAGADRLLGGDGNDVFDFNSVAASGPASADTIVGFAGAGGGDGDRIDLGGIDANTGIAGNQAFVLGGTGAGRVRLLESGTKTLVVANVDRDADPELRIFIEDGSTRAAVFNAADFIL
jgi:arylsulfatase A-like enzyme